MSAMLQTNDQRRRQAVVRRCCAFALPLACLFAEQTCAQPVAAGRLVGVGSCTAAGCHGDGHASRIRGSEYNIWITQDQHAQAYSVLFNERSQRMMKLLANSSSGAAGPAHEDARCLACHSTSDVPPRDERLDVISDGVGCEACHGPAEHWLAKHYEHPLSKDERQALGLWNTDSLRVRSQVCVRCHVGSPGRDVNHELIAAGHPRLEFEMGAYFEQLPEHWDLAADPARERVDFDAVLWALGQASASQAALVQLANRAESGANWPEFAEWECAACHHDLRNDAAIQAALAERGNLSGRFIPWDTWNHFTARLYAADVSRAFGLNTDSAARIQTSMRSLDDEMRDLEPDRRRVGGQARAAAAWLGEWAASIEDAHLDRPRLDWLSSTIATRQASVGMSDWSTAAQTYDALASLHQTRLQLAGNAGASAADRKLTLALQQLYQELAAGRNSTGVSRFEPERLRQRLIQLEGLLPAERTGP